MANKNPNKFSKIKLFTHEFLEGDFFGLAAEMSFYILSSFLPMVIFVFTITSAISQKYTDAMIEVIGALPDKMGNLLIDMLLNRTTGVTVMLITGAFSLFTVSQFVLSGEKSLNRFFKTDKERGLLLSTGLSFIFAFFILISIISSFALIIFGGVISDVLFTTPSSERFIPVWDVSRHLIILVFVSLIISALFKALPTIKIKWKYVIPGALFTTLGWYVASMLFALYVNNFPNYEIIYGSLAGFACMIMWIYIVGIVVIIGAKINALLYLHSEDSHIPLHKNLSDETAETNSEQKES